MKWRDRLPWLGLAGLVLWVFRRPVLEGAVLYKRDIHLVWHPQVEAFVRAIASGSWPLWDPGLAWGQPLLADPSAQIAYPPTWLNLVLRPWTYYTLFAASHVVFSGIGLFVLARRWGMSRGGGFAAAGVWVLSGPFLSLIDLWHHLASAAWIPWVWLAAEAAFEKPGLRSGLLLGLAMAGQILGGSADMSAMTGLIITGQAIAHHVRWRRPLDAANRSLAIAGATALALALGLSAVLWLPALDVASRSARWALSAEVRTYWSLHPLSIVETLVPVQWRGLPLTPALSSAMFEGREPFLASIYLGAPSLVLVCAGLAFSSNRRKKVLAVAAVLALLVATGRNTPFYGWMASVLPPLQILRYPVKAMAILAVCWALLAGLGVDAWRGLDAPSRRRWIAAVVVPPAILACAALASAWMAGRFAGVWAPLLLDAAVPAGPEPFARAGYRLTLSAGLLSLSALLAFGRSRRRMAWSSAAGIAILTFADLAARHRNIEPVAPKALYAHRPEILESLPEAEHPRLYVYDYSRPGVAFRKEKPEGPRTLARAPAGWDLEAASALGMQASLTPVSAGRWGIDRAFEIDYRGLYPWELTQLCLLLRHLEGTPAHLKLLQIGGVTHVVALHEHGFEDLVRDATIPGFYHSPISLFRVPGTLPRTYVVGGVRAASGAEAFAALVDPTYDPRREVVLPEGESRAGSPSFSGTSQILERRPDRVWVAAELTDDGYVVLLDSYDPGWQARIDGQAAPLLRGNVAFRAVKVPAGRHTIEFFYRPHAALAGLTLSAATLVALLVVHSGLRLRSAP